jgi:3,4-dihydroxy 2-butanone 4-phosphate synthase/GTP cyclohydrolase II
MDFGFDLETDERWAPHGSVTQGSESVEHAVEAIAAGQIVIVVDEKDREDEADLIMAATKVTAEKVAFFVRNTSGILCVSMSEARANALRLDPMVACNNAPLQTAFTVSVDFKLGLTTGISAGERAATIVALADGKAVPGDFVRPGHVFPLIARKGGVLARPGHTEAAFDLVRLAGLPPVGLLAELVNDNGTVKRGNDLQEFAKVHGFRTVSVGDLIAYRERRETLVERIAEFTVNTTIGRATAISFRTPSDSVEHMAVVFGEIDPTKVVPVRIHFEEMLDNVVYPGGTANMSSLSASLEYFRVEGGGVLVHLRDGPIKPPRSAGSSGRHEHVAHWRRLGIGAKILRELGISQIRLVAGRKDRYAGLDDFGIAIVGMEPVGQPYPRLDDFDFAFSSSRLQTSNSSNRSFGNDHRPVN